MNSLVCHCEPGSAGRGNPSEIPVVGPFGFQTVIARNEVTKQSSWIATPGDAGLAMTNQTDPLPKFQMDRHVASLLAMTNGEFTARSTRAASGLVELSQ